MGRPPQPFPLRVLKGTAGRRPSVKHPAPPRGIPKRPKLPPLERAAWNELVKLLSLAGIVTVADGPAIELAAVAWADGRRARKALRDVGSETYTTTTESGTTMYRARPEVAMRNDADRRLAAALAQLGLSPTSRVRIQVPGGGTYDPLMDDPDGPETPAAKAYRLLGF